ncbi:MAG: hypothetical protein CMQ24_01395 [Gammaproteobacteria bacterium]|nr:hypothetical protein [Gammaproteobacteria bacterium]
MAQPASNDLLTFGLVPLGAIVGAGIVAAVLSIFIVTGSAKDGHHAALANNQADVFAGHVEGQLAQVQSQLTSISSTIRLSQVLGSGDPSLISLEESALTQMVPNAVRVRLFPTGSARVERNTIPPFSFPSLDLVTRAENGEPLTPEALEASGRWLLTIATPVRAPSSSIVNGALFVYLDMRAISAGLPQEVDSRASIVQTFPGGAPSDIFITGSGAPGDAPVYSRKLSSEIWEIRYQPSDSIASAEVISPIAGLVPVIAALLIALGGGAFGMLHAVGTVRADADWLSTQVEQLSTGTFKASTAYKLAPFKGLEDDVVRLHATSTPLPAIASPDDEPAPLALEEDATLPPLSAADAKPAPVDASASSPGLEIEDIDEDVIHAIGQAIGSEAIARGEETILVGADGRVSSPAVSEALIRGLSRTGCDVVNLGTVSAPVLYFATHNSEANSGVMVTGAQSPVDVNGFKVVLAGDALTDTDIERLYQRVLDDDFASGQGTVSEADVLMDYVDAVADDVLVAQPLKVVVDCGHGTGGLIAEELYNNLGCETLTLYDEVDGDFPERAPEPFDEANLAALADAVRQEEADLGLALGADADRVIAVTADGSIVWPDQLLMLFARDVVVRNPGSDVVYDVRCTRHLSSVVSGVGGRPIVSRCGHTFIKQKMRETDAVLGGEATGQISFSERWFGFEDGLYAGARLLEIVGSQSEPFDALVATVPFRVITPQIQVSVNEDAKFGLVERLEALSDFGDGSVSVIDGLRVDYPDGFGIVRASNSGPFLELRLEGDDDDTVSQIQDAFREQLAGVDERLNF